MSKLPISKTTVIRLVLAVLILGLFYGALFYVPKTTKKPELAPAESQSLLNLSKDLLKDRKYQEALVPAQKLYEAYPDNHIYIEQMADIYDQLHRYKEEAEFWERYRQHAPLPITACPEIGQAYQKAGMAKEAIAAFEWCLSLDTANTDSIFSLAHSLERNGEFDRAAEIYSRGLRISPDNSDLLIGLARVQIHLDKISQAEETAIRVLKKMPDNTDALFVLGMAYYWDGDLVHAREYLENGVKKAAGNSDFYILLGKIAEKEKKIPEAIQYYDKAVELNPEDREIRAHRDDLKR
jgi:tetratricopeptide (TPR) repeat protein